MELREIDLLKADFNPFKMVGKDWFLITAGNDQGFNTMTASWGGFGVMWNKNVATIVVRPQRRTIDFLNESGYFTISFFDEKFRDILKFCGANSGRDVDKIQVTGLKPIFLDGTTTFEQANKVLICKKLFSQKIDENSFIDKALLSNYPSKDFHYAFVGEILKAVEIVK